MVKSKKVLAGVLVFAVVCALSGIAALLLLSGKKPFRDLKPSEIASAAVRLCPPDKTVQIAEKKELADYLNDVVIYRKDNSYTECDGQGVTFTLDMKDGTQTEIMAYNPFLVIDGVGYRTKYAPCEALSGYANRLLKEEDAVIILEEPPALDVISENTSNPDLALRGTYSWQCENSDGTTTSTEADSAHPLDCRELLMKLETTETAAMLLFAEEPDEILYVRCWSDGHWSDPAADSEDVPVNGNEIELRQGGYIYEVSARWDTKKSGCGGTAYYSFYAELL